MMNVTWDQSEECKVAKNNARKIGIVLNQDWQGNHWHQLSCWKEETTLKRCTSNDRDMLKPNLLMSLEQTFNN